MSLLGSLLDAKRVVGGRAASRSGKDFPKLDLGQRIIRSAGLGSGSIEVTLPAALRDLAGRQCRITLRDGLRPEVVLVPDLRGAREALQMLWSRLAETLAAPAAALPLAEIGIALTPDPALRRLSWTDGLALAAAPPHGPESLGRSLRPMAMWAAETLGLPAALAPGFGAAVAFTVTGLVALPEDQEACDIAAASLGAGGPLAPAGLDDALDAAAWRHLRPSLRRLHELHLDLASHPDRHASLRRAWRRGVALELTGD